MQIPMRALFVLLALRLTPLCLASHPSLAADTFFTKEKDSSKSAVSGYKWMLQLDHWLKWDRWRFPKVTRVFWDGGRSTVRKQSLPFLNDTVLHLLVTQRSSAKTRCVRKEADLGSAHSFGYFASPFRHSTLFWPADS